MRPELTVLRPKVWTGTKLGLSNLHDALEVGWDSNFKFGGRLHHNTLVWWATGGKHRDIGRVAG